MTFVTAIGPSQDVRISCHYSEPFSEQFTHGLPCGRPRGTVPGERHRTRETAAGTCVCWPPGLWHLLE